ncbi:MAG: hypothetical protein KAK04_14325 [Cyclobacteriaceae bacterium]|nr:hypothetical protein [Cyclobacteriaceae bacterium]
MKEYPDEIKLNPPSGYNQKVNLREDLLKVIMADKFIDSSKVRKGKEFDLKVRNAPVVVDDISILICSS